MDRDGIQKIKKNHNMRKYVQDVFLKICTYIGVFVVCLIPVAGIYYMNKIEKILEDVTYSDGMRLHKEMIDASEEKIKQEAEEQLKKDARRFPRAL
tara:strand:- start:235 stop:522 length:288 start_codon:yes stop_codon:yes gene_type:complete